jgi:hypothetical protein
VPLLLSHRFDFCLNSCGILGWRGLLVSRTACLITTMSVCRRPGGMGPVVPDGNFDLTPCFEDAISLALLTTFIIAAVVRVCLLLKAKKLERSRKSLTFLWFKEVLTRVFLPIEPFSNSLRLRFYLPPVSDSRALLFR